MGEMKWTDDQHSAIWQRDHNILVSAAAGSGKTAVLVERILQEVMDQQHPLDIDRLLVVTFTRAAAAQMRTRIGEAMEDRLLDDPSNERLQRQLSLLHNAQITTIDSFCQSIIRNYFHVIDLDPVFRVADETEMTIMRQEVVRDILEESYQRAAQNDKDDFFAEGFLQLADMVSAGRDDSALEGLIQDIYQMAVSAPWPDDHLEHIKEQYHCSKEDELYQKDWFREMEDHVGQMLAGFLERARQTKEICDTEGPAEYSAAIQSDIDQLEKCAREKDHREYARRIAALYKQRMAPSKADKEQKEYVQSLRRSYMDKGVLALKDDLFFQPPYKIVEELQCMYPAVCALSDITKRFMDVFAARKREVGVLDFSDMEHFALQILIDHEKGDEPSETAKELQEYYQEIMIDEYQDSSYIQEAILSSLGRASEEKPPYLFMVGDVKQSIYRFRQARPELFNKKYEDYAREGPEGIKIDLHQNFRSRETVLESVNYLFRQLMQKCLGGIEYNKEAHLVPGAFFEESEKKVGGKSQILLIEEDKERKDKSVFLDKEMLEAAVIGEKIKQLMQGEDPLYIKGEGGYHRVRYRDIVILLRSPGNISEKYIEVLGGMGIPAYSETRTGYFGSMEVETILNLLRIIDNPRQDIPLAAVLRSRIGGLTDDDLAMIGAVPHHLDYWDAIVKGMGLSKEREIYFDRELTDRLSCFLEMLERYRDRAQILSVYELLCLIYQETGYYDIMSAMPAGEKRAANLDLLLQRALEYAKKGNHGIFSFVHYIDSIRKAEIDFGEASLTNENMDAVRIMSIHKSKGLEFPVVFLAGMAKKINQSDAVGIVKDSDHGIGIDLVDMKDRYKRPTVMKKFLAIRSRNNTLAEEIRILYVALTRAKELLILSGVVNDREDQKKKWERSLPRLNLVDLISAKRYIDWIMPLVYMQGAEQYFEIEDWDAVMLTRQAAIGTVGDIIKKNDLEKWDTTVCCDEEICQELKRAEEFTYLYESDREIPVKISVSELKRLEQQARQAQEELWEERDIFADKQRFFLSDQESDIPRPVFLSEERGMTGAERGTLYHLVFQHLPFQKLGADPSKEKIDCWLDGLAKRGYMSCAERENVQAVIFQDFLRSSLGQRMISAAERGVLYREQQFMLGIPARSLYPGNQSEELVLVQGIIDAWFLEGEDIVLVDYKTDKVSSGKIGNLAEKYKVQLEHYAEALQRMTGHRVKERIIYSVSLGRMVMLD